MQAPSGAKHDDAVVYLQALNAQTSATANGPSYHHAVAAE
jgi:hypothetical protein